MIEKYLTDSISRPALEKKMMEGDIIHSNIIGKQKGY
jgi:hypothetical protein